MEIGRGLKLKVNALLADIRDKIGMGGRYFFWGVRDNFPNIVIQSVNDSGTARLCVDKVSKFAYGRGLREESYAKKVIGPDGYTRAKLAKELSLQLAYIPAVILRVKYNYFGEVSEVAVMEPQHVRRRHDGSFIYGRGLGDPANYKMYYTDANRQILPAYKADISREEVIQTIAEQKAKYGEQVGFCLYVFNKGVGLNYEHYPVPIYSSGLNDLKADAGLSVHEEAQVYNSFKAGVIINTRKLDHETKDADGRTEFERLQERIEEFTSPDGDSVLLIEGLTDENNIQVTPLNIQHQMDATEQATERIAKKVCRLFNVPPLLIGIETAGKLGSTKELMNHLALFNLTLEENRQLIKEAFEILWPLETKVSGCEFEELDLFDQLPDEVIKMIPYESLKEMYNIPEPEVKESKPTKVGREENIEEDEQVNQ